MTWPNARFRSLQVTPFALCSERVPDVRVCRCLSSHGEGVVSLGRNAKPSHWTRSVEIGAWGRLLCVGSEGSWATTSRLCLTSPAAASAAVIHRRRAVRTHTSSPRRDTLSANRVRGGTQVRRFCSTSTAHLGILIPARVTLRHIYFARRHNNPPNTQRAAFAVRLTGTHCCCGPTPNK